ncbi:MAG: ISL3 family transposase [Lysobacteraceae bacterium]
MDLLDLEGLESLSFNDRDGVRVIEAKITATADHCLHCSAPNPYKHDAREQEFADAPVRGMPIRILFQRQRYRCRECRKTFFQPIAGLSAKRNMTRRLVHYIAKDSLIRTFADVGRDVALDTQTVRGVFKDFGDWLHKHHPIATPEVMGIDEAKRAKRLCTVLTDLQQRDYFDLLPSRQAKPLHAYLKQLPDKERIKVVAMDLHLGFVAAIERFLPHAVRVADRYHVARLAQNAFDKLHVATRKGMPRGERLTMFRRRGLLAQRTATLTNVQRQRVAETLAPYPLLKVAYEAKESFLTIYDARDRQQAEKRLSDWLDQLPTELTPYFRELTSALTRNRGIILNYFQHRYTNAFTEASNGLSKLIQRMGRGYGFEVLRVKLLYGKRAQSIDISEYDVTDDKDMADRSFGYSFMTMASIETKRAKPPRKEKKGRRGPAVARVARLVDEGYYDPGNDAIAKELDPLIADFAASY